VKPGIKLVLFDIDGTILLTSGAGRRAIVAAITDEVGATGLGRVRFDGKTDPQIVAELLDSAGLHGPPSAERVDAICRRYVDLLAAELERPTTRTTVMPGVLRLLDELERQQGVVLGLLTGNIPRGAE
jgi:phosphoglycolate phosphatase